MNIAGEKPAKERPFATLGQVFCWFIFKKLGVNMYPYHNKIKQRIKNGELIRVKQGAGEFALILIFNTPPFTRPIRPHSVWRYEDILNKENFYG